MHLDLISAFRSRSQRALRTLPCLSYVLALAAGGATTFAASATADTGAIAGRVSNQATSAYLEGAEVVLNPSGMSTLTSRDGRYSFSQVPAGTYTLSVS